MVNKDYEKNQDFIEKHLPNYYSDDRIFEIDLYERWLNGEDEDISIEDKERLEDTWGNDLSAYDRAAYYIGIVEAQVLEDARINFFKPVITLLANK